MVRKRIRLAQNFFRSRDLVGSVVASSTISTGDIVYEIGPGEGIITHELAERGGKVVAVEKDPTLVAHLREKFRGKGNVEIREGDFLGYRVHDKRYKVFSNIPFNITAEVIKGFLFGNNPPIEAYLIVQKEAAQKFSGNPRETEVSVLSKPWFEFKILKEFRRYDFEPVPSVDVVLLHITRRENPLVSLADAKNYKNFVRFGFRAWKKDLKIAYKQVFSYEQWKRLSRSLSFPVKATPSDLRFEQWLGLFEYFSTGVVKEKRAKILSR